MEPRKEIEKLRYMHRNPVKRGLVGSPELWQWSSFRFYAYRENSLVLFSHSTKSVLSGAPSRFFCSGLYCSPEIVWATRQFHGVDPHVASDRLYAIKKGAGLGPADNVVIGRTGDVYNSSTGEYIGSLTQH